MQGWKGKRASDKFYFVRGEGGDSGWQSLARRTCHRPYNKSISCPTLRLPGLFMLNLELLPLLVKFYHMQPCCRWCTAPGAGGR